MPDDRQVFREHYRLDARGAELGSWDRAIICLDPQSRDSITRRVVLCAQVIWFGELSWTLALEVTGFVGQLGKIAVTQTRTLVSRLTTLRPLIYRLGTDTIHFRVAVVSGV